MVGRPSIESLTAASAAVSLWRIGGKLHVAVAVKAALRLVPDGRMTLAPPTRIDDDERAPYRPGTDVSFVGRAYVGDRGGVVRLGLFADEVLRQPVLSKSGAVQARGPVPEGIALGHDESGRATDAAFAPLPAAWPGRRCLWAHRPEGWLAEPIVALEDDFDWSFFRTVPPDQQCAFLQGNEWLVLDGLVRSAPRLRSQLPQARAVVRVMPPTALGGPLPLETVLDTLAIDGEAGRCEVTWRGSFSVEDDAPLAAVSVFSGVELDGKRLTAWPPATGTLGASLAPEHARRSETWRRLAVAAPVPPTPPAVGMLSRVAQAPVPPAPVAPCGARPAPVPAATPPARVPLPPPAPAVPATGDLTATLSLTDTMHQRASHQPPVPFSPQRQGGAPPATRPPDLPAQHPAAPHPRTPWPAPTADGESALVATVSLSDVDQATAANRHAVPFPPASPPAPASPQPPEPPSAPSWAARLPGDDDADGPSGQ